MTRYLSDYNFHTVPGQLSLSLSRCFDHSTPSFFLFECAHRCKTNEPAVQWSSWMRRTRRDPPTLTELEQDYYRQLRLKHNVEQLKLAYEDEKLRLQQRNDDALLLTQGQGQGQGENEDVVHDPMMAGLPSNDTGIGPKEAEIGKNLGVKPDSPTAAATTKETSSSEPVAAAESSEEVAQRRRNEEREAARKRREEFGQSKTLTPLSDHRCNRGFHFFLRVSSCHFGTTY